MAKTFSSKSPRCLRQHWWAVQPRHDCQLCCGVTAGILLLSNTHAEICAHTHSRSKCSPGHAHKQALFLSSMNTITHIHTHSLVSNPQKLHITKKRRASCHRPALRQERAREREREPHTRDTGMLKAKPCYLFMSLLRTGSLSVSKHSPWASFLDSKATSMRSSMLHDRRVFLEKGF